MQGVIVDLVRRSPLYGAAKRVQEATPARRGAKQRRVALYRQFVGPGDLCFDVGANVGNRVEAFLALGARVVALEPQLACVQQLKQRFGKNAGLTVLPLGLAAEAGTQQLFVAGEHTLSSMSADAVENPVVPGTTWNPPIDVAVSTLDAIIGVFGTPQFAKIDVEGFESQVLAGLSYPLPALSIEANPTNLSSTMDCLAMINDLGDYEYSYSLGESMQLDSDWVLDIRERLHDADWGDVYARLRVP